MLKKYGVRLIFCHHDTLDELKNELIHNPSRMGYFEYIINTFAEDEREARRNILEHIDHYIDKNNFRTWLNERSYSDKKNIFLMMDSVEGNEEQSLWDVELKIDGSIVTKQVSAYSEYDAITDFGIGRLANSVEIILIKPSTQYIIKTEDNTKGDYNFAVTFNINNQDNETCQVNYFSSVAPTEEELQAIQGKALSAIIRPSWQNIKVVETKIQESSYNVVLKSNETKKTYQIRTPKTDEFACILGIIELAKENNLNMDYTKLEFLGVNMEDNQ
ncbi:hypothetical protein [Bacillus thuringiensis]|uniref:hypothetical protein n=1 Tax=Bacillus thuringiensis TaxID=1428 RepID=UPI000BF3AA35|nr:hypothetical protein [Bacillus thuringiensis]PFS55640.1 hypothetical protein COK87_15600 [Bacillus thuringiensis]